MAKFEHGSIAIADSYAKTLLELTEKSGQSDAVAEDFGEFDKLLKTDEAFAEFMYSQSVDSDTRETVLEKNFRGRMNDLLLSTIQVVNRKERCELLELIRERFRLALEVARNEVDVYVTSAIALTDDLRESLRQATSSITGKTVRFIEAVDPSILGGLVVRIGDEKLDNSVINRLQGLNASLMHRATEEIQKGHAFAEATD
jgi:F-type H+-transporting ATPase subunit delta